MGIFTKNQKVAPTDLETKKEEVQTQEEQVVEPKKPKNGGVDLTIEEFEYLFNLIKNSTFKGTELEIIYSIILKLQKRYLEKKQ
ncbi:hypothetical protein EB169_03935 [archaeon]|jgi:hypothetical protein|nr:hypothetical protein [archaeon]